MAGETPSLTGESIGGIHMVLECIQAHPPGNLDQKGPICMLIVGEVTKSGVRTEQEALFPLGPLPDVEHHNAVKWVALPWQIPEVPPHRT